MGRFSDLAEQITGITTPPDEPALRPNWAGSFVSHGDWVNRATMVLVHNAPRCRTTGNPLPAMCVDALGRRCNIGADFSRARDEGAFPVYFFFECVTENTGRLTDFVPPPTFAESARAGNARMFDFHNRSRAMIGLDRHELVAAGVLPANDHNAWGTFTRDPYRWFIRADDETALKLWELIERRATVRTLA